MKSTGAHYLVSKSQLKHRALTLRIPMSLHDAMNDLRERADKAGFHFDVQAAVVEALGRAIERVDQDLAGLENPGSVPLRVKRRTRSAKALEGVKMPEN